MTTEGYLTSRQAMAYLGLWTNIQAFSRAVHRYGIPHQKIGRLAFQRSRLDAWMKTYRPEKSRTSAVA